MIRRKPSWEVGVVHLCHPVFWLSRAVTGPQPSVKGANNFDGFKTKSINRRSKRMSRKAKYVEEPSSGNSSPLLGSSVAPPHSARNGSSALLKEQEGSRSAPLSHRPPSDERTFSLASCGDAAEDQVHKLQLKLLEKLKAKKKKLAAFMSSPHCEPPVSDHSEPASHCGPPNDCDSIEELFKELQYQIALADNKSGCTSASDGTSCNSQTHEEILAVTVAYNPDRALRKWRARVEVLGNGGQQHPNSST